MTPQYALAIEDVRQGVGSWHIWGRLAWREIKRRYRRTVIGPFWASFNLATMVFAMGFLWAELFNQSASSYMPYLCAGLVTWQFIATVISEGAIVFTTSATLLTSLRVPQTLLVATMVWRNVIVLFHNLAIYALVMMIWRVPITWNTLLFIPGLALLALNGLWVGLLIGIVSTRLRDIPQLLMGLIMITMFVTPVMWSREVLKGRESIAKFIDFNPFYHIVEVVRSPLLGRAPALESWAVTILLFFLGGAFTLYVFSRFRQRIIYWL